MGVLLRDFRENRRCARKEQEPVMHRAFEKSLISMMYGDVHNQVRKLYFTFLSIFHRYSCALRSQK